MDALMGEKSRKSRQIVPQHIVTNAYQIRLLNLLVRFFPIGSLILLLFAFFF